MTSKPKIPSSYLPCTWRCVTPIDDAWREIGVAFNLAGGVTRLRLSVEHARHLSESIAHYLRDHDARLQSAMSSEMPSEAKSIPEECECVCPPAMSSIACSGLG
jgi:hypothetical protein